MVRFLTPGGSCVCSGLEGAPGKEARPKAGRNHARSLRPPGSRKAPSRQVLPSLSLPLVSAAEILQRLAGLLQMWLPTKHSQPPARAVAGFFCEDGLPGVFCLHIEQKGRRSPPRPLRCFSALSFGFLALSLPSFPFLHLSLSAFRISSNHRRCIFFHRPSFSVSFNFQAPCLNQPSQCGHAISLPWAPRF